jgi:site-specific recombinase XerD
MTETHIVQASTTPLLIGVFDKDGKSRIGKFEKWLVQRGLSWQTPDLAAYRDDLLQNLSPATVAAHLSSIRGRYNALLNDNGVRTAFYAMTPQDASPSDKKAVVDELMQRLENAVKPSAAPVKQTVKQDRADSEHLRLTRKQASALIAAPGVHTLTGLRDTALIALILCTGIREAEAVALDVADLRQRFGGELALHIRKGKGSKERLVPYGELAFCLPIVDTWLNAAGITGGAVFRGFYKGGKHVRPGRLTTRAVQMILGDYPVMIDGHLTRVQPHDLRRTYARRLYEAGVDIEAIRQNLGHADRKTTQGYIGTLGAELRKPPAVYDFDLGGLTAAAPLL